MIPRIVVIGDIMVDAFRYGSIDRICPEAPVPVFKYDNCNFELGGAGNTAHYLANFGACVGLIGMVGNDRD